MMYRAIRICSDYHLLHEEFEFIKDISLQNGYPLRFVESQIRKTLNRTYKVKNKSAENSPKVIFGKEQGKKNNILVEIWYVEAPTSLFGKQLARIGQEINPNSCIQIIPKPPMTVGNYFPLKDPIPKNLCSRIVYHIKRLDCDAAYIGKTIRQATRRLKEHGAPLNQNSGITPTTLSQIQSSAASNTLRRSARNIGKMVNYRLLASMTEEKSENVNAENISINIKNSALNPHAIEHQHKINWEEWKIITKDPNWYRVHVRESLHILDKQPELNKTVSSVPLIIYPEGLGRKIPKIKMKKYMYNTGGYLV